MIIAVLSDIHDNIWKLKDIGMVPPVVTLGRLFANYNLDGIESTTHWQ